MGGTQERQEKDMNPQRDSSTFFLDIFTSILTHVTFKYLHTVCHRLL